VVLNQNVSVVVPRDGHNETRVLTTGQAFSRRLHDGSVAVVMLNRQDRRSMTMTLELGDLGLPPAHPCKVRDLIARQDLPDSTGNFSAGVGAHEAKLVRISCT
jgi:hypothetical protein